MISNSRSMRRKRKEGKGSEGKRRKVFAARFHLYTVRMFNTTSMSDFLVSSPARSAGNLSLVGSHLLSVNQVSMRCSTRTYFVPKLNLLDLQWWCVSIFIFILIVITTYVGTSHASHATFLRSPHTINRCPLSFKCVL